MYPKFHAKVAISITIEAQLDSAVVEAHKYGLPVSTQRGKTRSLNLI